MAKMDLNILRPVSDLPHDHIQKLASELFKLLTDEERLEIINEYCKYCGSSDSGCQCWNDE